MNHDEVLITRDELLRQARSGLARVRGAELEKEAAWEALLVDVRTAEQRARDSDLPGGHVTDLEGGFESWKACKDAGA